MRWWSRGDGVFLDMCIYFLIMVLLTKSLYLSFIMFNIIYKIRFSCLASFLLCVPLYGAQNFVDVGNEKEGHRGTVGDQLPAQNAIVGNEAQVQREVF